MNHAPRQAARESNSEDHLPSELLALKQRLQGMPLEVRSELEPIVDEALEEAKFRGRILSVAREALLRQRLDLLMAQFDLDVTRQERERLKRKINARN